MLLLSPAVQRLGIDMPPSEGDAPDDVIVHLAELLVQLQR